MKNSCILFYHSKLIVLSTLLALLLVISGCSGGSNDDGDNDNNDECTTADDCPDNQICKNKLCVDPGNGEDCQSNFDCSSSERCDMQTLKCVPLVADGDIDSDVDGEMDIDDDVHENDIEESPLTIAANFTSPLDGEVIDGEITLALNVVSELIIDKVEFFVGNEKISEVLSEPWQTTWQSDSYEETDELGLKAIVHSGDINFTTRSSIDVDHSTPELTINMPAADKTLAFEEKLLLEIDASDHLKEILIYIDDTLVFTDNAPDESGTYSYELLSDEILKGARELKVEAIDLVDSHNKTIAYVSFIMDNLPPKLVIDGVDWDENDSDIGEIFAEMPLTISYEDHSALKQVSIKIKLNGSMTLLDFSIPANLPLVIDDFNSLLPKSDEMYPAEFTITANAVDMLDNESVTTLKTVTVKRMKWEYDPAVANEDFDPPENFEQTTGASTSSFNNNIYVNLYNQLHAISFYGEALWQLQTNNAVQGAFVTSPVIAEADGLDPVIISVTQDGTIYFKVDDGEAGWSHSARPDDSINKPTAPSVESIEAIEGGLELVFYFCVNKTGDSKCFKLKYTHLYDTTKDITDTLTELQNKSYAGFSPPTNIMLPVDSGITEKPTLAVQAKLMQLSTTTLLGNPVDTSFTQTDTINAISYVPKENVIVAISDRMLRLYSPVLTAYTDTIYKLIEYCGISDIHFMPAQVVSDEEGTVIITSYQCVTGTKATAVVEAYEVSDFAFGQRYWMFELQGLPGGTPTIGQESIAYVAGSNAHGNIWAIDIYGEIEGSEKESLWQVRIGTPILSPLLVSSIGDLLVVGSDSKVRAFEIPGTQPLGENAWPTHQSQSNRLGHFSP